MFRFQVLLVATLGCAACSSSSGDSPDAAELDGSALFDARCRSCHGDGTGTNLGPTVLNVQSGYATFVVRSGRNEMGFPNGGMAAIPPSELADPDLAKVMTFLAAAPKPATGPELYVRFCQNCHGADGRGGRVAKNIVREVNNLSTIVRTGHGGSSFGARTSYMPKWSATELTDAEVTAIRTHVSGL